MRHFKSTLLALATSLALVACGGGSSADTTPRAQVGSVKVFGDSLADSGTYGYKFTLQASDSQIYPERIAAAYGKTLCPYYKATGANSFVLNPTAGCTNYAIGGGRVNFASNPGDFRDVTVQLAAAGATGFAATDLAIIDGGGNDAADLISAFLVAGTATDPTAANIRGLLASLGVTPASLDTAGLSTAGGAYMTKLADRLAASVTTNVLGKGATQVVILNLPAITKTPKFQMVLASIKAAKGADVATQLEALFNQWIGAYNTELAAKFASEPKVVVVDFYTSFLDEVASPAQFGLTNATTPACPAVGVGSDGLPTYDFPHCTTASLSANVPTGASGGANWWQTYAFSDSFHPTLYGHQLVSQLISKSLAIKGWL
ncbi:SGNH/GDSL hydrolase family protein [Pelomonas sp. KK5]|uniref:SGNH/GDSL hydrolase family protein n=1 Tax=Pelomonas sp. KK5 TaxID=1855730 RepID=UPI00097CBC18|nr:SGNH/GDSL hydrolase family protein [Pelomonas sp. KK5]